MQSYILIQHRPVTVPKEAGSRWKTNMKPFITYSQLKQPQLKQEE